MNNKEKRISWIFPWFIILCFLCGCAEEKHDFWAKTYGTSRSDYASSIQQTADDGFILAGSYEKKEFEHFYGAEYYPDLLVIKLSAYGQVEWSKSFGYTSYESASFIRQTTDGGYIIAGCTGHSCGPWILKLGPRGDLQWQWEYLGYYDDSISVVNQTSDGGYIASGSTSIEYGNSDAWVLKLAEDGSIQWQKVYGGPDGEGFGFIQQTEDGGYIVAGTTSSFGTGSGDFWVLKLSGEGAIIWQRSYGGEMRDSLSSIHVTVDGGYVVVGRTSSFDEVSANIWVLKLLGDGKIQWQKTYDIPDLYLTSSIVLTPDGGYILAGIIKPTSGFHPPSDIFIMKISDSGDVLWSKTYGGSGDDNARDMQQTSDGGFIVVGYTKSFGVGDYSDILVFKLSADGTISSSCSALTIQDISVTVADTSVSTMDTDAMVEDTSAFVREANIYEYDIGVSCKTICTGDRDDDVAQ